MGKNKFRDTEEQSNSCTGLKFSSVVVFLEKIVSAYEAASA